MARVTVEDCIKIVPNRFDLVLVAAHRARLVREGAFLTIERDSDKDPVIALREIAAKTISPKEIKESIINDLQEVRPNDDVEREADNVALKSGPAASEAEVMRALQADNESGRDDRH